MRIVLVTDAWEPQVNGVVRTLTRTVAECRAMGHEVEVIEPSQFKTIPCPTYPEIRLALGAEEEIRERLRAFEPEAVHIATEGPLGIATRRICVEWKLPFTTSYHTKFPEYVSARFPIPVQVGYAYMKWFHKPSGRLMVATPTLRDELVEHGFKNVSPWTRGVDTELFRPDLEPIYKEIGGANWPRPFFLNVGRVAVEKNIETCLGLDLPGTKIIVGDGPARAGDESELRFTVTKDGLPVRTEPYLGAGGHLVALRDGDLAFLHVHPNENDDRIGFEATFPTAGAYRLFLQFKVNGAVQTVAFTEEVR